MIMIQKTPRHALLVVMVFWLVVGAADVVAAGTVLDDAIEKAARLAATESVRASDPENQFDVSSFTLIAAPDNLPQGALRIEPIEVDGPNASGVVRILLRVLVNEESRGNARVTVRGRVSGPVLVAKRTLARSKSIPMDSVEVELRDITRLPGKPLREPAETSGLVPIRTLGAGQPLTDRLLAPMPVVRRGQIVDMRIMRRGLSVVTKGRARSDGVVGQTIVVVNIRSGVQISGRVLADGTLLVGNGMGAGSALSARMKR